eukprot:CAMPEP_0172548240 /NCGR_PEP_ID=MMETSP1067-20121228/17583_1 /TAXON_ID=265564 ORGANISM="Thalassiosira punctigera, Strain Tpunct2005C2" /NCGR_SAMPLE_ID=MMETSP1067 /ASSEMBLY_ACC=CAM_ASM_000444 /LENGTH=199 /DNA_ID=CAMNT_0013335433 /DNA_START=55 /DNA_END=654 /DNA_ORIENTATION=+
MSSNTPEKNQGRVPSSGATSYALAAPRTPCCDERRPGDDQHVHLSSPPPLLQSQAGQLVPSPRLDALSRFNAMFGIGQIPPMPPMPSHESMGFDLERCMEELGLRDNSQVDNPLSEDEDIDLEVAGLTANGLDLRRPGDEERSGGSGRSSSELLFSLPFRPSNRRPSYASPSPQIPDLQPSPAPRTISLPPRMNPYRGQ